MGTGSFHLGLPSSELGLVASCTGAAEVVVALRGSVALKASGIELLSLVEKLQGVQWQYPDWVCSTAAGGVVRDTTRGSAMLLFQARPSHEGWGLGATALSLKGPGGSTQTGRWP